MDESVVAHMRRIMEIENCFEPLSALATVEYETPSRAASHLMSRECRTSHARTRQRQSRGAHDRSAMKSSMVTRPRVTRLINAACVALGVRFPLHQRVMHDGETPRRRANATRLVLVSVR
jgi:hypothetical protein